MATTRSNMRTDPFQGVDGRWRVMCMSFKAPVLVDDLAAVEVDERGSPNCASTCVPWKRNSPCAIRSFLIVQLHSRFEICFTALSTLSFAEKNPRLEGLYNRRCEQLPEVGRQHGQLLVADGQDVVL